MATPLLPAPLASMGSRRFRFEPPIREGGPNEWMYRSATWLEIVVMNARTGKEMVIPRRFVCGALDCGIVALSTELRNSKGVVRPHSSRVITMPEAAETPEDTPARTQGPARVVPISLLSGSGSASWRSALACAIVAAVFAAVVIANVLRLW